jgi:hypothetical protein
MRFFQLSLVAALAMSMGYAAQAELQNVTVDGAIRIRGNYYDGDESLSLGDKTTYVEQRTRLGVTADFTDEVSARIEFDAYHIWGGGTFRSDYVTGADGYVGDGVNLYQAYINVDELWGSPLSLRIGRQEIAFGSQWLAGVNDASSGFWGLSYDGVRLTYTADEFTVDAFATKLAEGFDDLGDSDVAFYGIYASYLGLEDIVIDGYWMWVRDDGNAGYGVLPLGFDSADIHTLGLRGAGTIDAFDFEAEVAYQFGDVEDDDFTFLWIDFDDDKDISALGVNLELGYTFDANWQPRLYAGMAFLEGGDQGDDINSLWDLAWDGWDNDSDDLSFNRLFSNWEYSEFLENTDLSNVFVYRLGLSVMPTESLSLALAAAYFVTDEAPRDINFWWDFLGLYDDNHDDTLGIEVGLYADYAYSEDLSFRAGFAHFFGDDATTDHNFVVANGLLPFLGADDDGDEGDYNYLFFETEIAF